MFTSYNPWKTVPTFTCKSRDHVKRNGISSYSPSSWYGRLQCSFSSPASHGTVVFVCLGFLICVFLFQKVLMSDIYRWSKKEWKLLISFFKPSWQWLITCKTFVQSLVILGWILSWVEVITCLPCYFPREVWFSPTLVIANWGGGERTGIIIVPFFPPPILGLLAGGCRWKELFAYTSQSKAHPKPGLNYTLEDPVMDFHHYGCLALEFCSQDWSGKEGTCVPTQQWFCPENYPIRCCESSSKYSLSG